MVDGFYLRIPRHKSAMVISENLERTPFAREDQFWKTIPFQIAPDRAADQTDLVQHLTTVCIKNQPPASLTKEARGGRLRVEARNYTSPHKHIETAIAIEVRHGQRTGR